MQHRALVHGDVPGLVAFDLILRLGLAGMVGVALLVHVAGMHLDDFSADVAGFGIPSDVVADLEGMWHAGVLLVQRGDKDLYSMKERGLNPGFRCVHHTP